MRAFPLAVASALASSLALSGCSTSFAPKAADPLTAASTAIQGRAQGGQQPIVGMKIYLYAAGTGGYGTASQSLLASTPATASDGTNFYVTTDSNGAFSISGDYTCPAGGTSYLYLYGVGGNSGAGINSATTLMAPLGACAANGNLASVVPYVWMNEVTTVVAAYSLAGWMASPLNLATDNTAAASNGLATAFSTATLLENIATGTSLGNVTGLAIFGGTAPQATVNTLANILAACVNSASSSSASCTALFSTALSGGTTGTMPTDIATAIVNIAHHPAANTGALFALQAAASPFQPALSTAPSDWTLARVLVAPGIGNNFSNLTAESFATDSQGYFAYTAASTNGAVQGIFSTPDTVVGGGTNGIGQWLGILFSNHSTYLFSQISGSAGAIYEEPLSSASGPSCGKYTNAGNSVSLPILNAQQYDSAGSLWSLSTQTNTVFQFPGGVSSGCPATAFTASVNAPVDLAADASGNIWLANQGANNLLALSANGTPTVYTDPGFSGIAHIAVGAAGEIITAGSGNTLTTRSSAGTIISECAGNAKRSLTVDGANARWMVNSSNQLEFCPAGAASSTLLAPPIDNTTVLRSSAIDPAGNLWILSGPKLTEVIGVATPPTLPLATAAATNKIGVRP